MSIVHRRVFHGKVGMGDQLIEHMQEGNLLARSSGVAIMSWWSGRPRASRSWRSFRPRSGCILTPSPLRLLHSGLTDRVVVEWEAESIQELEAVQTEIWVYPEIDPKAEQFEQGPELFREWFAKLKELIEYAEAETWQLH